MNQKKKKKKSVTSIQIHLKQNIFLVIKQYLEMQFNT